MGNICKGGIYTILTNFENLAQRQVLTMVPSSLPVPSQLEIEITKKWIPCYYIWLGFQNSIPTKWQTFAKITKLYLQGNKHAEYYYNNSSKWAKNMEVLSNNWANSREILLSTFTINNYRRFQLGITLTGFHKFTQGNNLIHRVRTHSLQSIIFSNFECKQ